MLLVAAGPRAPDRLVSIDTGPDQAEPSQVIACPSETTAMQNVGDEQETQLMNPGAGPGGRALIWAGADQVVPFHCSQSELSSKAMQKPGEGQETADRL